jgi:hypothetical protein
VVGELAKLAMLDDDPPPDLWTPLSQVRILAAISELHGKLPDQILDWARIRLLPHVRSFLLSSEAIGILDGDATLARAVKNLAPAGAADEPS